MEINKEDNYEISPMHAPFIDELIKKRRYKNRDDFITKAIDVYLTWERDPASSMKKMSEIPPTPAQFGQMVINGMSLSKLNEMYPGYPEKFEDFGENWLKYLEENSDVSEIWDKIKDDAEHRELSPQAKKRRHEKDFEDIMKHLSHARNFVKLKKFDFKDIQHEEVHYDGWPLLFTHYSRLLPAKIALMALGEKMISEKMTEDQEPYVNLKDFQVDAFDIAEEISSKLNKREKDKNRNETITTGLPKPPETMSEEEREKHSDAYKERYFGKIRKNKESGKKFFDGLISALGLVRIFEVEQDDGRLETVITFSEKGKKFYLYDNPQFNYELDEAFYTDEKEFIIKELIPQRKLEYQLIEKALKIIEKQNGDSLIEDIESAFLSEIKKYLKENKGKLENNFEKRLDDIVKNTEKILDAKKYVKDHEGEDGDEFDENERISKKQTQIEAIRIATLGRMSELDLVEWNITNNQSSFAIGKLGLK